MDDRKITPEQLDAVLAKDYQAFKQAVCDAMNAAKAGRIIADSEEPVRDANAEFRRLAYQKAIDLLASQQGQEDFSPSAGPAGPGVEEQGKTGGHARHRQRRR